MKNLAITLNLKDLLWITDHGLKTHKKENGPTMEPMRIIFSSDYDEKIDSSFSHS